MGPIVWTAMSELMPNCVRSLAVSIASMINWIFDITPDNNRAWWTFCFIMVMGIIFVVLFVPETKGHSLEEIQEYFEKGYVFAVSCGGNKSRRSYIITQQLVPPRSSYCESDE